ncbi:MAG: cation transporter [Clostridiales bacterium]|nr:cation transporter [Clostridiales bacterium]
MKTEKNILIAFLLNISFSIFELIGGIFTNSIAIISDAIHDFGDATSIGIAYFLEKKSKKQPDATYTYGYARYSILGAIITNTILIVGSAFIIFNAVKRVINPEAINYNGMIIFAIFGVIINFVAAYFTKDGDSLNQKAVNLHMLEDVLGWVVVLIGAVVIKFTEVTIIDPIMSIFVAIFILVNALRSYKTIVDLFLEKIPEGIDLDEIKEHLSEIENVCNVHHIHVWSMDGVNNYATMHVVTDAENIKCLKCAIKEELREHGISHTTIEFEKEDEKCGETECHVEHDGHSHHHHHHH